MLKELRISNYALIEELGLRPDAALNTITGETGAGKSIMLGALGLILGQRADLSILRDPEQKCVVEADFDLSALSLESFFKAHDLDYEQVSIIRREIIPSGKSRAFVNDTPVKLPVLRELSEFLIDIHGQNQTRWLADGGFQMDLVDGLAQNAVVLENYRDCYRTWSQLQRDIQTWEEQELAQKNELDYHQFLLNELEEAALLPDELNGLEEDAKTLEHAEDIRESLSGGLQLLDEDESGIISNIKALRSQLSHLSSWSDTYALWMERIEAQLIEWDDLSFEMNRAAADVVVDPARLEQVNNRIDLLHNLMQKHQVEDVPGLLEKQEELHHKVSDVTSLGDRLEEARKEQEVQHNQLLELGQELGASRRKAQKPLIKELETLLNRLGMPDAAFDLHWIETEAPGAKGLETVEFLFSANKGRAPEPLKKVASGGEMSRFMLGMKNLMAQYKQLPTILFDEIDTGVSGEIADRMGTLMSEMGSRMQVICITHLPQVAAKGSKHFKVYKELRAEDTYTDIKELSGADRVEEVASMLSGARKSEAARQNARELLEDRVVG